MDDQVAHEDAERPPHQRVDAAAMTTRPHIAAIARRAAVHSRIDLPDEQHERARDVVAVGEETPDSRDWTSSPPPSG